MNPNELVEGLSELQADGLACVACEANYLRVRVSAVPVGRSVTGSQVHACVGQCAESAKADIATGRRVGGGE
ncbi:hypothetical protein [Saccharopolyspora sp. NPDC002376]